MDVVVRQKTKGRGKPWWVFVSHNGRRTSKKVGDKEAAEKVASTIMAKLKLGEFDLKEKKPVPTFGQLAEKWMETIIPATCKPSTAKEYRDILNNHVLRVFESKPIDKITRGDVKTFLLSKVNDGYAQSTVAHFRNCISGVLGLAVDHELIPANPAQQLKRLIKPKDRARDINPLSRGELRLFLDTVKQHFPDYYPLFLLLARTGMRLGEALALKWGDIDFNGRFIEIRRNYVRGKIQTPKSNKIRKIDMSQQLAQVLKEHRNNQKMRDLKLGLGDKSQFVFVNKAGNLIDKGSLRSRVFKKSLGKAELRHMRIHDLRHTYATIRISKDDNVADVSNQLGHHSVKFTYDTYYHWVPGNKKDEVDGLDDSDFFAHSEAPYTPVPEKWSL